MVGKKSASLCFQHLSFKQTNRFIISTDNSLVILWISFQTRFVISLAANFGQNRRGHFQRSLSSYSQGQNADHRLIKIWCTLKICRYFTDYNKLLKFLRPWIESVCLLCQLTKAQKSQIQKSDFYNPYSSGMTPNIRTQFSLHTNRSMWSPKKHNTHHSTL